MITALIRQAILRTAEAFTPPVHVVTAYSGPSSPLQIRIAMRFAQEALPVVFG
jgi:hypothetical protein